MRRQHGPYPNPGFGKQVGGAFIPPMIDIISGELTTASLGGRPLGIPLLSGIVRDVVLSVGNCGDPEHGKTVKLEADVFINGTSCLSTKPSIQMTASGETGQQMTTITSGETGVISAIINTSARSFSAGDVFTWKADVTRTSPDTEMKNAVICVEVEPYV